MPDDRGMSPGLFQQLTEAILDHSAEEGLRMITTVRSYLDTWETFLRTGTSWLTICVPPTTPALPAPRPIRPASTASTGTPTAVT